jgi:GntR family transcriptional regulator/MocR family aminotransferase
MRELMLDLPIDDAPFYLRLARALRHACDEGRLAVGELLPSTRLLALQAGVHRHTVMAALDELVAEGWLAAEPRRGYRVVATDSDSRPQRAVISSATTVAWRPVRTGVVKPLPPVNAKWSFPSGQPDLRLFPTDEYYACIREVLRHEGAPELLGYREAGGIGMLIEQLWEWLRRMRAINDGDLVVTHGSQEAIFLIGQMLVSPGDVVAVEALGYPPAWHALRMAGAKLEPLPLDEEGMVPEALERLARRKRVRMLYLTPLHQYPTTVTLQVPRRRAIYDIALRHGIAILEDDYDHEFHYRSHPLAPMKSHDPAGIVWYVSTFSKVLYPSARLGFAVVPAGLGETMRGLKQVVSRQNDTLTQEAVGRWMRTGGLERHLRRMRRAYAERMEAMLEALQSSCDKRRVELDVVKPSGGMSLWVSFGLPADDVAERALRRGVHAPTGTVYQLRPGPMTHLRLGFASSTPDEIRLGIDHLVRAARG